MENKKVAEIWDYLEDTGIATDGELQLASNLCGYSVETMEAVIYAKTGYRSLEQLKSE